MPSENIQIQIKPERFQSAEQMWFWFLYSKQIQNGYSYNNPRQTKRVCELLDVETMITRLYLSGTLTNEHLIVMKEFGDKRRSPHQYIWNENSKAAIWNSAMAIIELTAKSRGWID